MVEAVKTKLTTKPKAKAKPKVKAKVLPKKVTPKAVAAKTKKAKVSRYFEAVGRRKSAVARTRLYADKSNKIIVNEMDYKDYFPTEELRIIANAPLRKLKLVEEFGVSVKINGGGKSAQAEAMRHGIARSLLEYDPELRLRLKKSGYLKRDPREKERRKYGLKKARKAPQWSKR